MRPTFLISTQILMIQAIFASIISIYSFKLTAAPITFNTALPVAKDAFLNREQFVFRRFKSDSSPLNRDLKYSYQRPGDYTRHK